MTFIGPSPTPSARDFVYTKLKSQILSLELPPGTALSEKESSLAFSVSRTPVRESFLRLAQEGLVQVLPQRGTFVSLIDPELVEEARFMREQLEKAVIRLACESFPSDKLEELRGNLKEQQESMARKDDLRLFELDEIYHRTLFEGCGKLNTWAVIQQMNVHLNRTRLLRLVSDHQWNHLYEQHETMVQAIEAHDAGLAESTMQEHLLLSVKDQVVLREKFPHYFK
ncbi:GntR family transcriptional regulator [Cohnella thailandensis]|uniref:GntR family transcriptional regulator n=1 Tax=Cohnella thailandensis TaxID=557557 RepID=A0A841SYM1_9BACL|nr:GntR family transcriptional regulator [Cohnella thailandensis]MBB6635999.1 GntR family transcriptional regulator [Cohnella thailandensis]MBP1976377.1 DNA-binding GntR family transcriptional regulator [Cohnella thailandensis]